ncbi:MAG: hypothetical protein ACFCVA_09990 [Gammaproteobacteria bacterium]
MKKTSPTEHTPDRSDELRQEYRFDYARAKPNRFAGRTHEPRVVVVLDPDVAEVFQTPDSVNEVLRALIQTMPKVKRQAPKAKKLEQPRKPDAR